MVAYVNFKNIIQLSMWNCESCYWFDINTNGWVLDKWHSTLLQMYLRPHILTSSMTSFFCCSLLKTFIMLNGRKYGGTETAQLLLSSTIFLFIPLSPAMTSLVRAVFCEDGISGIHFTSKFESDVEQMIVDIETFFCNFGETGRVGDSAEKATSPTDSGDLTLDDWPTDGTAKQSGVCGGMQGLGAIGWSLMQLKGLYGTTDSTTNIHRRIL